MLLRKIKKVARRLLGYHDLNLITLKVSDLRPYLWEYRKLVARRSATPAVQPQLWCGYLTALLECDETDEFEQAYARFCELGGCAEQIKNYLWLSDIAEKRGEKHPEVARSARIYRQLMRCHQCHSLESYVKGKTVAVVGNGPSELGKGLGGEIDAHDVVIRLNVYKVLGFEQDYGSRTDIWVKHTTSYLKHEIQDPRIRMIVYAANWQREGLVFGYKDALEKDLKERMVDFFDASDRSGIDKAYKALPTTGAFLLEKLRHAECKCLDAYGFSFLQDRIGLYTHYSNDRAVESMNGPGMLHSWTDESAYLATFFNGRRMIAR